MGAAPLLPFPPSSFSPRQGCLGCVRGHWNAVAGRRGTASGCGSMLVCFMLWYTPVSPSFAHVVAVNGGGRGVDPATLRRCIQRKSSSLFRRSRGTGVHAEGRGDCGGPGAGRLLRNGVRHTTRGLPKRTAGPCCLPSRSTASLLVFPWLWASLHLHWRHFVSRWGYIHTLSSRNLLPVALDGSMSEVGHSRVWWGRKGKLEFGSLVFLPPRFSMRLAILEVLARSKVSRAILVTLIGHRISR